MDLVQDWAGQLLGGERAAYAPYAYQAYTFASRVKSWMTLLVGQVSQKPDLATLALLLVIAFVSLMILNMLVQTLLFWLRLIRRALFWGGLVAVALWMWSRGPEGMKNDLQYGWDTWNGEYQYWKEQERLATLGQPRGNLGRHDRGAGWF